MTFRKMTEEDLIQVCEMEKEIFSQPWSKEGFLESIKQPYSHFFVAEEECIVGYCGVHNLGGDGEITNVAVDKLWRKRHIGTKLLEYAMKEGKKEGIGAFTLEVRTSNQNAIALYHKLGFRELGKRKNFYENPVEDALIMWKD